jgi:hypothetical protein
VTEAPIAYDVDRRALLAVAGLFAVNGALVGGVGATLPAMRVHLGVDPAGLSVILVSLAAAAVVSMQIGGRLTLGVRVERARGKPVMSRLHASFSIGNLVVAGTVLVIARLVGEGAGVIAPALVAISVVSLVGVLALSRWVPGSGEVTAGPEVSSLKASSTGRGLSAFALLLGAMAFSFGLAEGTAVDWSSVHVTDVARVDPATGALGLLAVGSLMILIRLFGDAAVASFGRVNVVRFGGLVAAGGYLVTLVGRSLPILLIGWALVGIGVGPAIVGALVRAVGIRHAMAFPLVLSLILLALSRVLSRSGPWEDGGRPASLAIPESPRILR